MISRVADYCFWLGRYLERAESTARMLSVTRNLATDAELTPRQCWLPVIIVAGEEERFLERFGDDALSDAEAVQRYLTWDEETPSSLVRSVGAAREGARSIREVVSLETWQTTNERYLWLTGRPGRTAYRERRHDFYVQLWHSVQLTLGLIRSTMLHEPPLHFIWLGAMLERVGQTARILDVQYHALTYLPERHRVVETALWLSLLRACSGFEPFMKRHQGHVSPEEVARFLIHERLFPRSVRFGLDAAAEAFCEIRPPEDRQLPGGVALERLRVLAYWLGEREGDDHHPEAIHEILTHVVDETAAICNEIGRDLFGYPSDDSSSEAVGQ